MKCENFCNAHCSFHCPNADAEYFEDKYGIPASDGGYEHVECKDCVYADKRCTCDDFYFKGSAECPRTEMLMKTMHDIFEIIISGMRKNTQTGNDMVLIAYRMLYDGRC